MQIFRKGNVGAQLLLRDYKPIAQQQLRSYKVENHANKKNKKAHH